MDDKTYKADTAKVIDSIQKKVMDEQATYEKIRDFFLQDYVKSITQLSPKAGRDHYICPLCGSGSGNDHTGAFTLYDDGTRWNCHKCHPLNSRGKEGGDIFDLYQAVNHCNATTARRELVEMYGERAATKQAKPPQEKKESVPVDHSAEVAKYAEALPGSEGERYLLGRGISVETQKRFHLGYDAYRNCVTMPYSTKGYYFERRYLNPADGQSGHGFLQGESKPLFNVEALYHSKYVFVVESVICAISIAQAGGSAIALPGTGYNRLLKRLRKNPTKAALLLCLDNDSEGAKAQEEMKAAIAEIEAEIEKEGKKLAPYIVDVTNIIMGDVQPAKPKEVEPEEGYRKDINEVLQRDGLEILRDRVSEAIELTQRQIDSDQAEEHEAEQAVADAVEAEHTANVEDEDSFLKDVYSDMYTPFSTGIPAIDDALQGGFTRQQLIMLSAAPGTGKTAFAQQMFETYARDAVNDCLYVNLEMSANQLKARSVSRIAFATDGYRINPAQVLKGKRQTVTQKQHVLAAYDIYKKQYRPHLILNPASVTADLKSILNYMDAEAKRAEAAGRKAPFVVLDYMQLITGEVREDGATVMKRAVAEFKKYAIEHDTIVFAIVANNRTSNKSGIATMDSGRDTSAIEYSADTLLTLSYTACVEDKSKTYDDIADMPDVVEDGRTKSQYGRITLAVDKARFGQRGVKVDMYFDAEVMTFGEFKLRKKQPQSQPQQGQEPVEMLRGGKRYSSRG